MIIADLQTRHFHFQAAGGTVTEAEQALRDGLVRHLKACNVPATNADELMLDVNHFEISWGDCLRDYSPI